MAFTPCSGTVPRVHGASPRLRSRSRSRSPLPTRAPTRRGSVLLSEGGFLIGLAGKCCAQAPPERTRLSRIRSSPPASAPCPSGVREHRPRSLPARASPICNRRSTRRLVRIHLTPPRLDGAAVAKAADAQTRRGKCIENATSHVTCGASNFGCPPRNATDSHLRVRCIQHGQWRSGASLRQPHTREQGISSQPRGTWI